jgi:hypothetical protein
MIAVCVIGLILLLWMIKRIRLAIGIIEEATKAIMHAPSVLTLPGFTFMWIGIFSLYWAFIAW